MRSSRKVSIGSNPESGFHFWDPSDALVTRRERCQDASGLAAASAKFPSRSPANIVGEPATWMLGGFDACTRPCGATRIGSHDRRGRESAAGLLGPARGDLRQSTPPGCATAILSKLTYQVGQSVRNATDADWYAATCLALRDREVDAFNAVRASERSREAGLLSVDGVPHRAAARRDSRQSGTYRGGTLGPVRNSASISTASSGSNRIRHSVTAASGALRPASWKAWRRSIFRPSATAFGTTTVCSDRRSSTAGSASSPTAGCPPAIPWEFVRPHRVLFGEVRGRRGTRPRR